MKNALKKIFLVGILVNCATAFAQLPTRIVSGKLLINDGSLTPRPDKYAKLADSLDKKLKASPKDTTCLFYRALLLDRFNEQLAKPSPGEKGALENLQQAANLVEKAISLKMEDFRLKVLRAQIYKDLCYRFGADQSWQFNAKQVIERRKLFNSYKQLTNKFYDELAEIDKDNSYDYQKLKETSEYPIKS
ncbi:hypothetical protein DIU31_028265 [Mucilaginibacter rubeus]|uniref:Peptidylprolyl isomerase n=1 Tax=Mucilaginibacter rubeus TaxID=2027860 RepID=A0AAE6MKU7_9SPHI|nr:MULTISPECIES: hypothetical protein [Mucilaginibacter]QEM07203.1 hypothetical protein DIU31_028265 [Mucilaginibacter rubeus]QEM19659.1 hypothetical protein DIU38_027840 [Mucilaginibacter gossypii]QTE43645.1 hypothetical protein J3L19_32790 [Mucilaginibacter rubeus]QTE50245.1 hypothetical protein J3L21_32745 [Mucilaginibacter rubeus]QTE55333.1 hypothetical protein J3L23_24365 [Mucilaginibacter rubeus]